MEQEVKKEENTLKAELKEYLEDIMADSETKETVAALKERLRILNMMFNDCRDIYRKRKECRQRHHFENKIQRHCQLVTHVSIAVVLVCWMLQMILSLADIPEIATVTD